MGGTRGAGPPLFLDQNEARRVKKFGGGDPRPPRGGGGGGLLFGGATQLRVLRVTSLGSLYLEGLINGGAYFWIFGILRYFPEDESSYNFRRCFVHSLSQYRFYHRVTTKNNNGKKQINYMKHVYFICFCCEVVLRDDNHCFFETSSVKCVIFTLNEVRNSLIYKFRVYNCRRIDQESGRRRTIMWMCYLQIVI